MRISLNWLRELVDVTAPAEEIADVLTQLGLEVEGIETTNIPEGIVVADVIEAVPHPSSDHLTLCKVDCGTGEILPIVCGAPNVRAGMRTALATIGTQIAPDFVIKKAKLRGEVSMGMLCSEQELGLSKDHGGIVDLPDSFVKGTPLSIYYKCDTILEVSLTPNRGDCQSVAGIAREVAAKYGKPLLLPVKHPVDSGEDISSLISVSVEDGNRCPRYLGRFVRGVKIAESPDWLKDKLATVDIRPINNVVDITNYILMLFGQPMHAFDYSTVVGKKIVVKTATDGQKFTTLDGKEQSLLSTDLLICDSEKAVALAGIMGGANSGISNATTDVFLECAYFEPTGVRKTAKCLGISTDSSFRFERGVDPADHLEYAIDTAAALIAEICGATVAKGRIDVNPVKLSPKTISLRLSYLNKLLGVTIPKENVVASLAGINIKLIEDNGDSLKFSVPYYRHDIEIETDLVEEAGRFFGYDNIPTPATSPVPIDRRRYNPEGLIHRIRHTLAANGFSEAISNPITSSQKCSLLTPAVSQVTLANPLAPEMGVMRTTLAAGLLEAVSHNLNYKNQNVMLFEIGRTFEKTASVLPNERTKLAMIIEKSLIPQSWIGSSIAADFYVLKGLIESLADRLEHSAVTVSRADDMVPPMFTEEAGTVSSTVFSGFIGKIKPEILKAFEIKSTVYYAELDISGIYEKAPAMPHYVSIPKFPTMDRDFCFVLDETILSADVCNTITGISPLIRSTKAFDVYKGEKLPAGKKSIAFATAIRSDEKTLTDDEANEISANIISAVEKGFAAELRK